MKRFVQAFGVPMILTVGLLQGDGPLTVAVSTVPTDGQKTALDLRSSISYVGRTTFDLGLGKLGQMSAPSVLAPMKPGEQSLPSYQLFPSSPSLSGPGDKIPRSYTVYGLRTGPGGMAFTDQNGLALSVPSQPRIITGPFHGMPYQPSIEVPPGVQVMPHYFPLPAPKK